MADRSFEYQGSEYFDFSDYLDFAKRLSINTKNFKQWLRYWFNKWGNEVLKEAKSRTPVQTGNLLASWEDLQVYINGDMLTLEFENIADYSGWVEYGHAKPYKGPGTGSGPDWVDGRFMITVPLQRFLDELPEKFTNEFIYYLFR